MSKNINKIFIRDLSLEMSIGIYDHEHANKQRVIVNITMDVESNADKQLHNIKDVVSYEDIVNSVVDAAKSKHYDLLEEFAEYMSEICLDQDKVLSVHITADKPDIIENCRTVGVDITRSRI